MTGPLMVAAGYKLLGQVVFLAAGLIAIQLGQPEAGYLLIGTACGSVVPVAEKKGQ